VQLDAANDAFDASTIDRIFFRVHLGAISKCQGFKQPAPSTGAVVYEDRLAFL